MGKVGWIGPQTCGAGQVQRANQLVIFGFDGVLVESGSGLHRPSWVEERETGGPKRWKDYWVAYERRQGTWRERKRGRGEKTGKSRRESGSRRGREGRGKRMATSKPRGGPSSRPVCSPISSATPSRNEVSKSNELDVRLLASSQSSPVDGRLGGSEKRNENETVPGAERRTRTDRQSFNKRAERTTRWANGSAELVVDS